MVLFQKLVATGSEKGKMPIVVNGIGLILKEYGTSVHLVAINQESIQIY